jgi:hypothetical protein
MNPVTSDAAANSGRICHAIGARCSRWARGWLEVWASGLPDEFGLYVRWPGERPPPPPESGPHREVWRDEWELAA